MRKKIRFRVQSQSSQHDNLGSLNVLPNDFVQAIGPFVFLRHIHYRGPRAVGTQLEILERPRPHRGIATITYILAGEVEHGDSIGNHVTRGAGWVHWMKTGNGVICDQSIRPEFGLPDVSVVEIWINLPSGRKAEGPDYVSLSPDDVPTQQLNHGAGWIKVLSGEIEGNIAKAPNYSGEVLCHIHLEAGRKFLMKARKGVDYAAFLLANTAIVNYRGFQAGDLVAFNSLGEIIEIINDGGMTIDVILFGGEPYSEGIVAEGSFVMNTPHEITQAYNDYYDGKYGQVFQ